MTKCLCELIIGFIRARIVLWKTILHIRWFYRNCLQIFIFFTDDWFNSLTSQSFALISPFSCLWAYSSRILGFYSMIVLERTSKPFSWYGRMDLVGWLCWMNYGQPDYELSWAAWFVLEEFVLYNFYIAISSCPCIKHLYVACLNFDLYYLIFIYFCYNTITWVSRAKNIYHLHSTWYTKHAIFITKIHGLWH